MSSEFFNVVLPPEWLEDGHNVATKGVVLFIGTILVVVVVRLLMARLQPIRRDAGGGGLPLALISDNDQHGETAITGPADYNAGDGRADLPQTFPLPACLLAQMQHVVVSTEQACGSEEAASLLCRNVSDVIEVSCFQDEKGADLPMRVRILRDQPSTRPSFLRRLSRNTFGTGPGSDLIVRDAILLLTLTEGASRPGDGDGGTGVATQIRKREEMRLMGRRTTGSGLRRYMVPSRLDYLPRSVHAGGCDVRCSADGDGGDNSHDESEGDEGSLQNEGACDHHQQQPAKEQQMPVEQQPPEREENELNWDLYLSNAQSDDGNEEEGEQAPEVPDSQPESRSPQESTRIETERPEQVGVEGGAGGSWVGWHPGFNQPSSSSQGQRREASGMALLEDASQGRNWFAGTSALHCAQPIHAAPQMLHPMCLPPAPGEGLERVRAACWQEEVSAAGPLDVRSSMDGSYMDGRMDLLMEPDMAELSPSTSVEDFDSVCGMTPFGKQTQSSCCTSYRASMSHSTASYTAEHEECPAAEDASHCSWSAESALTCEQQAAHTAVLVGDLPWSAQDELMDRLQHWPLTGTAVFGDAVVPGQELTSINRGAFGVVTAAVLHGQIVAVKKLRRPDVAMPENSITQTLAQRKRSLRLEIILLLRIVHSHIVRGLGGCLDEDGLCLVMECYRTSLEQELLEWQRRNVYEQSMKQSTVRLETLIAFLGLVEQVAFALTYLHEELQIVHCDVKPANIMLKMKDNTCQRPVKVKVGDFGAARPKGSSNAEMVLSTPAYTAPEIFRGQGETTGACDVFALAVMLWEGITGERPWNSIADNPSQIKAAILLGQRLPLPSEVPQELQKLMMLSWADAPSCRPSARMFAESIRCAKRQLHCELNARRR